MKSISSKINNYIEDGEKMDSAKFEQLYLSCKSSVERFVYYKMASKSDAEDIIQEVAVAAFKNMGEIKNPEHFKAWLLKIARNKCNDFYRALAKRHEIALDEMTDRIISMSRYGVTETEIVRDTLDNMADKDKQILFLYYFKNKPQAEIAQILNIPVGTVKSRLHTAKKNFKQAYPFTNNNLNNKGEIKMNKLPEIMPEYKITKSAMPAFEVKFEESPGWFIIPKLGEKITWAMYEFADKKQLEFVNMQVTGKANIHGIEGVEIFSVEHNPMEFNYDVLNEDKIVERGFIAQLTDTHCRFLAESYTDKNGVKIYHTFLDGDGGFNMYHGKDNCGSETNLSERGNVTKSDNKIICQKDKQLADIVGRYDVQINGRIYDTVCLVDVEYYNEGVFSEQYIDANGRTVLWRRFNKNDWNYKRYNEHYKFDGDKLWSEMFPQNEQVTVNGELYIHWYDCITDYILA